MRDDEPHTTTFEVHTVDGVASVTLGDALVTLWSAPARAARIRHVTEVAATLMRCD